MNSDDVREVLNRMFSEAEEKKLKSLHPDLVKVVRRARALGAQFRIGETSRSLEQQKKNVAKGVSKTLRSRHLVSKDGLCRAIDLLALVDNRVTWAWPPYRTLTDIVKKAAKEVKVPIECGIDWKSFKDGPHIQLPWSKYP
jgi:peptidoglycan L-alanyl-D-glutamate endopeptidase CwlK